LIETEVECNLQKHFTCQVLVVRISYLSFSSFYGKKKSIPINHFFVTLVAYHAAFSVPW